MHSVADIVIINPRFEVSFWGMEHALALVGKRANLPVACLPLLAALTPPEHTVTIIDENVEAIDWERCARADIVGVTGMSVQRFRMREILIELKNRGCFSVVGGPLVTVIEDYFNGLADAIFIGEAEQTWPQFLREWSQGHNQYRYEQLEKTDMSSVPTPRFDLLKTRHYAFGSLQFSRGCPFECEFCDIIVTFGRRPRIKSASQVIAELEALRAAGLRVAFVVDDNLIGNKKAIKEVLREVGVWQKQHGYPFSLFTEASIDLADDTELMQIMTEANFIAVFVGIESPNEDSLRETKKFQNVRQGGTLLEKVHRIQEHGMEVWCGMIMGFDNDDTSIFDRQIEFIQQARISFSMSGMLSAIPKTPLHARLGKEGRLDPSDSSEFGTNVVPLRMSRDELRDGYLDVLTAQYDPDMYFERTEALFLTPSFDIGCVRSKYWRKHPFRKLKLEARYLALTIGLYFRLLGAIPEKHLRDEYKKRFWRFLKIKRRPGLAHFYLFHIAMHYHAYTMSRNMMTKRTAIFNSF